MIVAAAGIAVVGMAAAWAIKTTAWKKGLQVLFLVLLTIILNKGKDIIGKNKENLLRHLMFFMRL